MNEIDFNAERGYCRVLLLPSIFVLIITIAIATSLALAPKTAFAVDLNRTVYCSRSGTKYHYVIDCSGMKSPISMSLGEARSEGRTPCSNCVHDTSDNPDVPSTPSYHFSDVNPSTPHAEDILWLYQTGISTGWDEGNGGYSFRGMDSVKRQDMAAFLYRLAGSPDFSITSNNASCIFSDVDESTPHYKEIIWLASSGISSGWTEADGSRTFRGMDSVKRQDMAAFLNRLSVYLGHPYYGEGVNPFIDVVADTPHRYEVLWLSQYEITQGWIEADGSRTFRGMDSVKRQDMAAFMHRMSLRELL